MLGIVIKGQLAIIDTETGDMEITMEDGEGYFFNSDSETDLHGRSWEYLVGKNIEAIEVIGNVTSVVQVIMKKR